RTPRHSLREERHFALSVGLRFSNLGLASNRWGQELRPTQPSLRSPTAIMITCSNSPGFGSGMHNHYVGDLLHTMEISGLSRVRTELVPLAIVQPLTPHPVQMHRQLASHRDLRDLSSSSQGEVEECAAPLGMAAHRNLRRFHQQKPEQHVALLADVSQSASIAAGVFLGHQSDVAGNLFAAVKTFR